MSGDPFEALRRMQKCCHGELIRHPLFNDSQVEGCSQPVCRIAGKTEIAENDDVLYLLRRPLMICLAC